MLVRWSRHAKARFAERAVSLGINYGDIEFAIKKQRVRIKVRAYDNKVIDQSVRTIIDSVKKTGVEVKGPVPLPTEKKKYTYI